MPKVLVILSANAEWRAILPAISTLQPGESPYGQVYEQTSNGYGLVWFQGGWGKISAAASAQWGLDHYQPDLIVNLGTCGGFHGHSQCGDILVADELIVYDIYERMGDSQEALDFYTTRLDTARLRDLPGERIRHGRLVSADRDIDPLEVDRLVNHFQAAAADWESGAIAWVAARNAIPCLVLRGVTDLVDGRQGEAYGNLPLFVDRTQAVMDTLVELLPEVLRLWAKEK